MATNNIPALGQMQIELVLTASLIPYAKNSKKHSAHQIALLAESMQLYGFTNPILIDGEGSLIAGHGRLLAAQKLKMEHVPCLRLRHLTDAQRRALVIWDNKSGEVGTEWDMDNLKEELYRLQYDDDFDMDMTGFSEDELDELLAGMGASEDEPGEGNTDEDDVPELPVTPISQRGDLWQLGRHRLLCGDSTKRVEVDRLTDGQLVDVLFTDPPYGIDYEPSRDTHKKIANDNLDNDQFPAFLDAVMANAKAVMKPDTYAFIWTGWSKIGTFETALRKQFVINSMHFWLKNNFGIGYYSRPKHEPFYLCLNGKPVYPSKAPADVWEAARVTDKIHSCEKPVGLIVDILDTYHKNSAVLDLFGGSGSTLIACAKTNRTALLMELDPQYVDLIVERWQAWSGEDAIHVATGLSYAELKAERLEGETF